MLMNSYPSIALIEGRLDALEQFVRLERFGQVADDPGLQRAGTDLFVRIGSDQYGRYGFARLNETSMQLKSTHAGHLHVCNETVGATAPF